MQRDEIASHPNAATIPLEDVTAVTVASPGPLNRALAQLRQTLQLDDEAVTHPQLDALLRSTMLPRSLQPDSRARQAMADLLKSSRRGGTGLSIEGKLGEGGMGVIRLGTQRSVGREVAIKSLREDTVDEASMLKLVREAWITAALEHPNILPVYDVSVSDAGQPLVVLQRIHGKGWDALLGDATAMNERFGEGDLLEHNLRILMQVCNAVSFAHSREVIHRDIKPENVMIGRFGEVVLLDWGLAVALADASGRFPLAEDASEAAGTPAYMAPEMLGPLGIEGIELRLSERTDVYLLGSVLYEIVCGDAPHMAPQLTQVLTKVLQSNPSFPPSVPPPLVAIIRQCITVDPAERFPSAEALRLALQDYLRHRGSDRLVAEADKRLDRLVEHLARAEELPSDAADLRAEHRQEAYNHFGAARFGFMAALDTWDDNARAREQLNKLVGCMIDYELEAGEPAAAEALLAELPISASTLTERVADAQRTRLDAEQRRRDFEREFDPRVGQRTRQFVGVTMAAMWTITPLLWALFGPAERSLNWVGWWIPVVSLTVGGALVFWARESLTGSAFNRRFVTALGLTVASQLVLTFGAELSGLSVPQTVPLYFFLWFITATLVSALIERRVAVAAAGYGVGFLLTAYRPQHFYFFAAGANFICTAVIAWVWRGASVRAE